MQYLLTKISYKNTPDARGESFSPFPFFREDVENKRSKLFPDRKRIPGRKTKYILVIAYLIHLYAFSKFYQQKRIYANKAEQQRHMQRRLSPFFQSIEDIRYTTLKHRQDLIMIEAFKSQGGAAYLQKFNRFTHGNIFVPNSSGSPQTDWMKAGTGRYAGGLIDYKQGRYLTGYNIQNI